MKGKLIAIFGLVCFAAGLGTGLNWHGQAEDAEAGADLPAKAPPGPGKSSPDGREITPAQRELAMKQARKAEEAREKQRLLNDQRQDGYQRIKPLIDDALQLDDELRRVTAIEGMRKAIGSKDPKEVLAGLQGLQAIYEIRFDKGSFREVLLPHLDSDDDAIRGAAWYGLFQAGFQDGDLALMRKVAREKGMGESTSHLLFMAEKGDMTGDSGEIVRALIDKKEPDQSREAMRGIWGAKLSPALEADIIALSREPECLHDAIYFALSTQANKSEASVDRLIEVLADKDAANNGGRAAWGLQQGVSKELAPKVADAAIKIVRTRASGYMLNQCWDLVKRYAGPANIEGLEELGNLEGLPDEKRGEVEAMIQGFNVAVKK
ncbi:hypothetical protein [Luteolibacter sp. Populi]|uniref:hypothetical protein n=1 Tax=Luteolibacter sp. Populi TaxID=3230487 RepID=UPI0034659425